MKPNIILIRGLPGAGKTTIARKLAVLTGFSHREADMFFERDGKYRFDPRLLKDAHEWCMEQAALAAHTGVIVSNTFTRRWEMAPYLRMGRCIVLHATGRWENIHGVPDSKISEMKRRWETIPGEIPVKDFAGAVEALRR